MWGLAIKTREYYFRRPAFRSARYSRISRSLPQQDFKTGALLAARAGFAMAVVGTLICLLSPASAILAIQVWVASWSPIVVALNAGDVSAYSDKLVHVSLFALLGCLAVRGWPRAPQRWLPVGSLLLFGLLTEVLQTQIPGRSASLADWLADALGLAVGMLLWRPPAWLQIAALRPRAP